MKPRIYAAIVLNEIQTRCSVESISKLAAAVDLDYRTVLRICTDLESVGLVSMVKNGPGRKTEITAQGRETV